MYTFRVHFLTHFGYCIRIVGDSNYFGNWDPFKGKRLSFTEEGYCQIEIPIEDFPKSLAYKYVLCLENHKQETIDIIRWEEGENHHFLYNISNNNSSLIMHDFWNFPSMQITKIDKKQVKEEEKQQEIQKKQYEKLCVVAQEKKKNQCKIIENVIKKTKTKPSPSQRIHNDENPVPTLTLDAENNPDRGATFYFTIPYQTEKAVKPITANLISYQDNRDITKKLKILVAEDDETSEILITTVIKAFGKEFLKVKTGVQAVETCSKNPDIDLILMDIQMPEMNGYEATRQIRQFNKEIIIIAQTAYGLTGDREKAIAAGCNDYISKPIRKDDLIRIIKKHFNN